MKVMRYYLQMPPLIGDIGSKYKRALEVQHAEIITKLSDDRRLWYKNSGQIVARVPMSFSRAFYDAAYNQTPFREVWYIRDDYYGGRLDISTIFKFLDIRVNDVAPYRGDVIVRLEYKRGHSPANTLENPGKPRYGHLPSPEDY